MSALTHSIAALALAACSSKPAAVEPAPVEDSSAVSNKRRANPDQRILSGVVVDATGAPVAGATVAVATNLIGSESSITAGAPSVDEMMGVRRAVTDADGKFRITGLLDSPLVAAAEHSEGGRSRPFVLSAATAIVHQFRLLPTGAMHGVVRRSDGVPARASVFAVPAESPNQTLVVETDTDGNYRFDKLAAGPYSLTANLSRGLDSFKVTASAAVKGGDDTEANIMLEVGSLELEVQVSPAAGAKVDAVQMFLFTGDVSPRTGADVSALFLTKHGAAQMAFSTAGKAVQFSKLTVGTRTLCAIPITGTLTDSSFMARVQKHGAAMKVYCQRVEIAANPAKQTAAMTVPEMAPLPTAN